MYAISSKHDRRHYFASSELSCNLSRSLLRAPEGKRSAPPCPSGGSIAKARTAGGPAADTGGATLVGHLSIEGWALVVSSRRSRREGKIVDESYQSTRIEVPDGARETASPTSARASTVECDASFESSAAAMSTGSTATPRCFAASPAGLAPVASMART